MHAVRHEPPPLLYPGEGVFTIGVQVSALLMVTAGILVFFRERLAYGLALTGGLIALPGFVWTELELAPWNAWIFLNASTGQLTPFEVLRILCASLVVTVIAISLLRLLPVAWTLRGLPLAVRTWPALLAALLVVAAWFVRSVTPYSTPAYDHPSYCDFRILHLEKRGLHFRETLIIERRAQAWVLRNDRRWFRYRFDQRVATTILDAPAILGRVQALVQSPVLWGSHTAPATRLWSWNAEGWYLVLKDARLLAFTSEDGAVPPEEVTALFRAIEKLPESEERSLGGSRCLPGLLLRSSGRPGILGFAAADEADHQQRRGLSYTATRSTLKIVRAPR